MELEWWGYLHESGTIQAKRFFNNLDLQDADESPFVVRRTGIIMAEGRDDAIKKIKLELGV